MATPYLIDANGNYVINKGTFDTENDAMDFGNTPTMQTSLNTSYPMQTTYGGVTAPGSVGGVATAVTSSPLGWGGGFFSRLGNGIANMFGMGRPQYAGLDDYITNSLKMDPNSLSQSERLQAQQLFQNQNTMDMFNRNAAWEGLGTVFKGLGSAANIWFNLKGLNMAKDNSAFMKAQANKNWIASAQNYNDRVNHLNDESSAFAGRKVRTWRNIDERRIG